MLRGLDGQPVNSLPVVVIEAVVVIVVHHSVSARCFEEMSLYSKTTSDWNLNSNSRKSLEGLQLFVCSLL